MTNLQLYASGSATASAVAQVTVPSATTLKGVYIAVAADTVTDNSTLVLEFSKIPVSQIAVNGAKDPFLEVRVENNLLTSGMTLAGVNQYFPLAVPCRQGEIVYVHAFVGGTLSYTATAIFVY